MDKPETFEAAVARAMDAYNAMTAEQQSAMWKAQRESFIRGMSTPCEHGALDFEQCPGCNAGAQERIAATARHSSGLPSDRSASAGASYDRLP